MPELTISEVARRGAEALRLKRVLSANGCSTSATTRFHARRDPELFFGFRNVARASERWQELSLKKLSELDDLMDGIESVRRLLKRMMQNCRCETLEQCGREMFRSGCAGSMTVPGHPAGNQGRHRVPRIPPDVTDQE